MQHDRLNVCAMHTSKPTLAPIGAMDSLVLGVQPAVLRLFLTSFRSSRMAMPLARLALLLLTACGAGHLWRGPRPARSVPAPKPEDCQRLQARCCCCLLHPPGGVMGLMTHLNCIVGGAASLLQRGLADRDLDPVTCCQMPFYQPDRPTAGAGGAGEGLWPRMRRWRSPVHGWRGSVPAGGVRLPGEGRCTERRVHSSRQPPTTGETCQQQTQVTATEGICCMVTADHLAVATECILATTH
jgi:hypothetical protein